jgi:hypothetical protein
MRKRSLFIVLILTIVGLSLRGENTDSIDVIHYGINLNVNNKINNGHIGFTDIKFKILSSTYHSVCFMLKNQTVDSVKTLGGQTISFSYSSPNITLSLPFSSVGDIMYVRVYYHGGQVIEPYQWGGIHYLSNLVYVLGVAFRDYPHSYARSWFVAKDSFDDKATYSFNIEVNKNVQAICGGILDSITNNALTDTYHYHIPQMISPYLCSLTIANFKTYTSTIHSIYGGDIPLVVHYIGGDSLTIRDCFSRVPQGFNALEKEFGRFRFNRVGYCVTPMGSMEHVDNISLAEGVVTDTNISEQSNIIHELAHSWFGNLITCKNQEEMWLNEGWTSFTTRISLEGMYGEKKAKDYFRTENEKVIKNLPLDEGYLSVYGIDSTMTYSSTVYNKGAMVAQTLRGMLGDSLFSCSVKDMLDTFAFKNVTSIQERDFLTQRTGINLTPFFSCFVFNSGYVHYEIAKKEFNGNNATITVKQRAYPNSENICQMSRIPITFMDSNYNKYKTFFIFNGDSASNMFSLPFNAKNVFLDMDEEIMDLTTDNYNIFKQDTLYTFPNTYFKANITNINDSLLIRPTLHWIESDNNSLPNGINRISQKHYWTIEGMDMDKANIEGRFYYQTSMANNAFDNTLLNTSYAKDSLMLLYRPNREEQWVRIPIEKVVSSEGYVRTRYIFNGDYVMAIGDTNLVSLMDINNDKNIKIYPNPCKNIIKVETQELKGASIKIYDIEGKEMFSSFLSKNNNLTTLSLNLKAGKYIVLIQKDKTYSKVLIIK